MERELLYELFLSTGKALEAYSEQAVACLAQLAAGLDPRSAAVAKLQQEYPHIGAVLRGFEQLGRRRSEWHAFVPGHQRLPTGNEFWSESSCRTRSSALGHPHREVIEHLSTAVEGLGIAEGNPVQRTIDWESCSLSKAHEIVSRNPMPDGPSDKPFTRPTLDIIPLETAMNRDAYATHVSCHKTNYQMVYTHLEDGFDFMTTIQRVCLILMAFYIPRTGQLRAGGLDVMGSCLPCSDRSWT